MCAYDTILHQVMQPPDGAPAGKGAAGSPKTGRTQLGMIVALCAMFTFALSQLPSNDGYRLLHAICITAAMRALMLAISYRGVPPGGALVGGVAGFILLLPFVKTLVPQLVALAGFGSSLLGISATVDVSGVVPTVVDDATLWQPPGVSDPASYLFLATVLATAFLLRRSPLPIKPIEALLVIVFGTLCLASAQMIVCWAFIWPWAVATHAVAVNSARAATHNHSLLIPYPDQEPVLISVRTDTSIER